METDEDSLVEEYLTFLEVFEELAKKFGFVPVKYTSRNLSHCVDRQGNISLVEVREATKK